MTWFLFNLQLAYSTELGASLAYRGHARVVRDPDVATRIKAIEADEMRHRAYVGELLERFGARPNPILEWVFWAVGTGVGFGCRFWGDWASAHGAAQFELGGVADYARCSRAARAQGQLEVAEMLELFEQQEREHRAYFLDLAAKEWASAPPQRDAERL